MSASYLHCFVDSLIIDCTALISERVAKVKESLNETMLRAACHSPAVVVFDDLDRLLPVEQEVAHRCHNRLTVAEC